MARLTVECKKFLNRLFFERTNQLRESSRTTLEPSSLLRISKILIYVNTDYHKLYVSNVVFDLTMSGMLLMLMPVRKLKNQNAHYVIPL